MTIDERINMLERELARTRRHQRWTALAIVLVIGASALLGFVGVSGGDATATQPNDNSKVVRARMFVVEDENGKVRAKLGLDDGWAKGIVALQLLDEDEALRFGAYGSSLLGGSLSLFDKHGKTRAQMSGDDETGPEFNLFDDEGKARARLYLFDGRPSLEMSSKNGTLLAGAYKDGLGPHLGLMDSEGTVRAVLGAVADSVRLELTGNNGELRAALSADSSGTDLRLVDSEGGYAEVIAQPSLRRLKLADRDGQPVAAFGSSDDVPTLVLFDQEHQPRVGLKVRNGKPTLDFFDNEGEGRATLGTTENGTPSLVLFDNEGRRRAALSADDSGPTLLLFDTEGKARAVLGSTETGNLDEKTTRWPESSLLLFGPDGILRWSAP